MDRKIKKRDIITHPTQNIILFDGVCNLCNGAVKFTSRRDQLHKFSYVPLGSDIGVLLCLEYGIEDKESIIYIRQGRCLRESTAVLNILYDLQGLYRIFYLFVIIPPFVRNFIYRLIARNRYRFWGKTDGCELPPEQKKE